MALPASGPIAMSMINAELAYPATAVISLNDTSVRALAGVPVGVVSLSNFYGKSSAVQKGFWLNGAQFIPPTTSSSGASSLDFSTETLSVIANAPENRYSASSGLESSTHLITGGGTRLNPTAPQYSNFRKFEFSTQSHSTGGSAPAVFGGFPASWVSGPDAGYGQGLGGLNTTTGNVAKYNLSTDSYSQLLSRLPPVTNNRTGQSNGVEAFFFGGRSSTPPNPATSGISTISNFSFATESGAAIGNSLPTPAAQTGVATSPTSAYLISPLVGSTTSAFKFSYASQTASNMAALPAGRQAAASVNNTSYAYFKGGRAGAPVPSLGTYMKLLYSTDTYSTTPSSITDNTNHNQYGGQPTAISF